MSNNPKKEDVVVLGGHEFKRVKNGLGEAQVASFIDELTKERDKLAQSQDHITSLNRLAERTVVEADKLAAQIKAEAEEQAKSEGAAVIDKAKEQARQMAEQKIAEAVEVANEKSNAIKAKAEEEAALLLENQRNKIRSELHNLVNQQFGYMLEELEGLKRQAAAVQADFDNKLSKPSEQDSAAATKIVEESDTIAAKIAEERDTAAAEIVEQIDAAATEAAEEIDTAAAEATERKDSGAAEDAEEIGAAAAGIAEAIDKAAAEAAEGKDNGAADEREAAAAEIAEAIDKAATEIAEEKDMTAEEAAEEIDTAAAEFTEEKDTGVVEAMEARDTAAAEIAEERDTTVAEQSKAPVEHPELSQTAAYIEKNLDLSKLLEIEDQAELGKPQWEVEILPPFNIAKIMEVVSFLDQLPEVANTEMIVPQIDMPSILVFLRGPMNLVDVLQTIPAVAHVEEVTIDKAATNGEPGNGPRKVRISLSENTTVQE